MKRTTYYKSEKWLNPQDSPSTGSIVCYDGDAEDLISQIKEQLDIE